MHRALVTVKQIYKHTDSFKEVGGSCREFERLKAIGYGAIQASVEGAFHCSQGHNRKVPLPSDHTPYLNGWGENREGPQIEVGMSGQDHVEKKKHSCRYSALNPFREQIQTSWLGPEANW